MPKPFIFDTHAHYTVPEMAATRDALVGSLPQNGVALVLNCGTDLASSRASAQLAAQYSFVYAAAGIHPQSLIDEDASTLRAYGGDWRAEMAAIRPLYDNPRVLAVGEVGLDHHWPVPKDAQLEMFEAHIRLALELGLPLCVHDREAHGETYALLKKYKPRAVLHAYSGSAEDTMWLCKQGVYIGFTGVVTFKNARRSLEAACAVPPAYLLLETDCPYMAPEPFRGKKSDSAMILYTAQRIAEARGVQTEALLRQCLENGKRLFGLEA